MVKSTLEAVQSRFDLETFKEPLINSGRGFLTSELLEDKAPIAANSTAIACNGQR